MLKKGACPGDGEPLPPSRASHSLTYGSAITLSSMAPVAASATTITLWPAARTPNSRSMERQRGAITRRGKVVAQLRTPAVSKSGGAQKPWERLRAMGGRLLADPGESVIRDKDFEALR